MSRLEQVEAPRTVCWSGRALGTAAIHVWTITPDADGVVVTNSESIDNLHSLLLSYLYKYILDLPCLRA